MWTSPALRFRLFGAVVALGIALAPAAFAQNMRVHFIDVGQGASTLLEFPCAAILVDTGGEQNDDFSSTKELTAYLDAFFAQRTDLNKTLHSLIITHPHIDHTRGIGDVTSRYKILNAVTNGQERSSGGKQQKKLHEKVSDSEGGSAPIGFFAAKVSTIEKKKGVTNKVIDPVSCPTVDPKITVLWGALDRNPGWSDKDFDNANNHSVVIRVDFGKASLLITGDLEEEGIEGVIEHHSGSALLAADVYLVGHHGAANATTEPFLQAIKPKIAVMAMGLPTREEMWTAWKYGHPRKVTVEKLEQVVSQTRDPITVKVATAATKFESRQISKAIYGTGWDGTLILEANTAGAWTKKGANDNQPPDPDAAGLIDINTATAEELMTLPRVGNVRAQAIIDHRRQHGRFRTIDDLAEVKGFGPATLELIRDKIRVGG